MPWDESPGLDDVDVTHFWLYNKAAINLSRAPLPDIGTPEELWRELVAQKLDVKPFIPASAWDEVRNFLHQLPRPVILLHTKGNTTPESKDLPDDITRAMYRELLDRTGGSLILLDWDDRVPRLASFRVRHTGDDWMHLSLPHLLALLHEADLMIGVDSGPLHAARFTSIPAIGLFPHAGRYPTRWCLPRAEQVNVVAGREAHAPNRKTRIAYNIVQSDGESIDPCAVARLGERMLSTPRYLDTTQRGADALLQQFILDWERGYANGLSDYVDRDTSYDKLLREMRARFAAPRVVETGCIRGDEDWRGAGYSTYLFGAFLHRFGGSLVSVDNDSRHCAFAREKTVEFACVSVHCEDAVGWLQAREEPIDVLLLDSMDTEHPQHAAHCLEELQAAMHTLHSLSLVIFDDTVYECRRFKGKGSLAVPYLLERGWRIFYSGYQTICSQ